MSPFWRKQDSVGSPPPPVAGPPPEPEYPPGNQPCTRVGCPNHNANECSYVDRRARRCETAWCPEHRTIISGAPYCPRHAGIMRALLASSRKGHLPDIDNRAPSLANWVGNDIDQQMRSAMEQARDGEGETLIVDPIGYIYAVHDQAHRWERAWKLANHTGLTLKAAIDVDEEQDGVVRLRVGQRTVNHVVPPWVGHHQQHELVSPEVDASEREAFYRAVIEQLSNAVAEERAGQGQRPYFVAGDT